jgi:alpha-tubulin suppressor-like RCC1 family protein
VSSPVSLARPGSYSAIFCGSNRGFWAIDGSSGTVYGWGYNNNGALGDNTKTTRSSPVSLARPGSYKMVNGSMSHTLFIDGATGNIWASGSGTSGALGNNTTTGVSSPVSIARPGSYSVIVAYGNTALAIDASTGGIWGWGSNSGQIGDNTTTGKSSPVSIRRSGSYSAIALGASHLLMIDAANGSIWATGSNSGQIGDNTTTNRSSPVSCARPGSYKMIAAGASASAAIDATDGSLWVWGFNSNGILGNNTLSSVSSPVSFARPGSYAYVHIGPNALVAIDAANGSLWTCGNNVFGQLGDGTTVTRSSPVSVLGNRSYVSAKAGGNSIIAMTADGTLYVWGYDGVNQLGRRIQGYTTTIIPINSTLSFSKIKNNIFLSADGNIYCTGSDGVGSLGANSNVDTSVLVPIARPASYKAIATTWSSTLDSYTACAAIEGSTGNIFTWGHNHSGQLGNNTIVNNSSPISIARLGSYSQISGGLFASYFVAIDASTGMVWGWGDNSNGQLGDNTRTTKSSPVSIRRPGSYSQVAICGIATFMIDASNGSIWGCGVGALGLLGNNTVSSYSSPVSLARPGSYSKIAQSVITGYAIDGSDGSVWAWGTGSAGQLGDGTTTAKSSPVSMLGGRSYVDVLGVVGPISGDATVYLLTAEGVVYACGNNSYGQFGNGTTVGSSSPVALPFSNVTAIHQTSSSSIILIIDAEAPVVDTQPTNLTKVQGETAQFSVVAHGNPSL